MLGSRKLESGNRKTRAFTLVELLVVITIIGILIALLLPAVQAAREAARRMQCSNNMKQTLLGMHLYHDAKSVFVTGLSDDWQAGTFVTWAMYLLPYLEQKNLLDGINYDDTGYVANQDVYRIKVATYLCPSDNADREGGPAIYDPSGVGFSRSNIQACFSADGLWLEPGISGGITDNARNPSVDSGKRALFNRNVARSIADVTDGTSHTAAISEMISGPNDSHDLRGLWWHDVGAHYEHMRNPNAPTDLLPDFTPLYCDQSKVPCSASVVEWPGFSFAAGSYHSGGVNVGLADGSVGFVSDRINHAVWQALGSINGGGKDAAETNPDF